MQAWLLSAWHRLVECLDKTACGVPLPHGSRFVRGGHHYEGFHCDVCFTPLELELAAANRKGIQ
jgi:hypothetical protein